jgi:hypothetical protein
MSRNYKCVKYLIRPDYYIRIKEGEKNWYNIPVYTIITGYLAVA